MICRHLHILTQIAVKYLGCHLGDVLVSISSTTIPMLIWKCSMEIVFVNIEFVFIYMFILFTILNHFNFCNYFFLFWFGMTCFLFSFSSKLGHFSEYHLFSIFDMSIINILIYTPGLFCWVRLLTCSGNKVKWPEAKSDHIHSCVRCIGPGVYDCRVWPFIVIRCQSLQFYDLYIDITI
jgi:hypothetical protein